MNFQPNRVDPVQFSGAEPPDFVDVPSVEDFPNSRLELALDTYRVFRIAGRSRYEALRHFFRVLRGNT